MVQTGRLPVPQVLLLIQELHATSLDLPEPLARLGYLDVVWDPVPMGLGSSGEASLPAMGGLFRYNNFLISCSRSRCSASC